MPANSEPLGLRPIALTGFMGVGKSAVGRRLAGLLDYEFVDTDKWVEALAGKSIPHIFEDWGEAEFRRLETQVLRDAVAVSDRVISTGGGLPLRPENRAVLEECTAVVLLTAAPGTILKRVQPLERRPLLVGHADPLERIRSLLQERREAYNHFHLRIDTTGGSPVRTAAHVAEWYRSLPKEQDNGEG